MKRRGPKKPSMENGSSVVIVENSARTAVELLCEALERSDFWGVIARSLAQSQMDAREFQVLIKPDLGSFDPSSPVATETRLVEALIDQLQDQGYSRVAVCAATDSSFLWAENREVPVLADLLGYKYVTPGGHDYDVLDLTQNLVAADFPAGSVLQDSELAEAWRDAHFRICFAKNRTDEFDCYALCLDSLLGVLPLVDKDYYYRCRIPAGEAVADLLRTTPVHFAFIDAVVSAHGMGGSRAPIGIQTSCVIASESIPLIDYIGALKMGLDPYQSQLAGRVFRTLGLPPNYKVDGDLSVYDGWMNVHPLIIDSHRQRESSTMMSRLLKPWLQITNAELFPLKNPIDAKVNSTISAFFENVGRDPGAFWLLVTANYLIGSVNQGIHSYRVLYDKDSIRQVHAPIGLQLENYSEADFFAIVPELSLLEPLLRGTESSAEGLRWRYLDGATILEFMRDLSIPFDDFVHHVDVAKSIQYMNDYIGGVVVPVRRDASGRVVLQAERNLYLPQPNYLALYQGKSIDVSKIEVCEYGDTFHRMYWKTIKSENDSAICDDGIVTFTRLDQLTRVQIIGRQHFVLPPFWQVMDLSLAPDIKAALVTHAYKTFFDRTVANFEALVEGRDVRIGFPWHTPRSFDDTEALPVEAIQNLLKQCGEKIQGFARTTDVHNTSGNGFGQAPAYVDEQGFRHFRSVPETPAAGEPSSQNASGIPVQAMLEKVMEFYSGLFAAFARDGLRGFQPPARIDS